MCASGHNDTTVKMRMSVISVTSAMKRKPGQLFAAGGGLDSPHESAEQSGVSMSILNPAW